ncbi:class III extradiol ring-cleavage dioxygenase [Sphingomonas sp.]|uniref:dioxygenase family protein n=1 Tax=Sphingomonas sp. TaxID=28214 RepID=UPI001EB5D2D8|nr:class III extradiol ring-cleavage dioxygenase [Sphingomonas sp.]MBX3594432.1 dioxygenase [Sphingomonas sp.]
MQPSLFVSHGSPMIMFEPGPARTFLAGLAGQVERPDAILMISAHHDMAGAVVTAGEAPSTIHDFGGFPQALFDLTYPAAGSPALAADVALLLRARGVPVALDTERGFDHGAWVPLMLGWPDAQVPVVQLSISSAHAPDWHFRLGALLKPLRARNVLIIGSGSLTHNLREIVLTGGDHDAAVPEWVAAFSDWIAARIAAGDVDALLHVHERAPHVRRNHPTMDHLLPLYTAMGAGGAHAERLHHSYTYGVLAMDAYRFD